MKLMGKAGKALIAVAMGTVAAVAGVAGLAGAEPPPPPPPRPNLNALTPVSPVGYSIMDNRFYAFSTPDGLTCALDRNNSSYGCSGPIPGAPEGANMISGPAAGPPGFFAYGAAVFGVVGPVKPLPANTRLSFRNISCSTDGVATTTCINSLDQTGFILSPAGSVILDTNPLLDRPEGGNPYFN